MSTLRSVAWASRRFCSASSTALARLLSASSRRYRPIRRPIVAPPIAPTVWSNCPPLQTIRAEFGQFALSQSSSNTPVMQGDRPQPQAKEIEKSRIETFSWPGLYAHEVTEAVDPLCASALSMRCIQALAGTPPPLARRSARAAAKRPFPSPARWRRLTAAPLPQARFETKRGAAR